MPAYTASSDSHDERGRHGDTSPLLPTATAVIGASPSTMGSAINPQHQQKPHVASSSEIPHQSLMEADGGNFISPSSSGEAPPPSAKERGSPLLLTPSVGAAIVSTESHMAERADTTAANTSTATYRTSSAAAGGASPMNMIKVPDGLEDSWNVDHVYEFMGGWGGTDGSTKRGFHSPTTAAVPPSSPSPATDNTSANTKTTTAGIAPTTDAAPDSPDGLDVIEFSEQWWAYSGVIIDMDTPAVTTTTAAAPTSAVRASGGKAGDNDDCSRRDGIPTDSHASNMSSRPGQLTLLRPPPSTASTTLEIPAKGSPTGRKYSYGSASLSRSRQPPQHQQSAPTPSLRAVLQPAEVADEWQTDADDDASAETARATAAAAGKSASPTREHVTTDRSESPSSKGRDRTSREGRSRRNSRECSASDRRSSKVKTTSTRACSHSSGDGDDKVENANTNHHSDDDSSDDGSLDESSAHTRAGAYSFYGRFSHQPSNEESISQSVAVRDGTNIVSTVRGAARGEDRRLTPQPPALARGSPATVSARSQPQILQHPSSPVRHHAANISSSEESDGEGRMGNNSDGADGFRHPLSHDSGATGYPSGYDWAVDEEIEDILGRLPHSGYSTAARRSASAAAGLNQSFSSAVAAAVKAAVVDHNSKSISPAAVSTSQVSSTAPSISSAAVATGSSAELKKTASATLRTPVSAHLSSLLHPPFPGQQQQGPQPRRRFISNNESNREGVSASDVRKDAPLLGSGLFPSGPHRAARLGSATPTEVTRNTISTHVFPSTAGLPVDRRSWGGDVPSLSTYAYPANAAIASTVTVMSAVGATSSASDAWATSGQATPTADRSLSSVTSMARSATRSGPIPTVDRGRIRKPCVARVPVRRISSSITSGSQSATMVIRSSFMHDPGSSDFSGTKEKSGTPATATAPHTSHTIDVQTLEAGVSGIGSGPVRELGPSTPPIGSSAGANANQSPTAIHPPVTSMAATVHHGSSDGGSSAPGSMSGTRSAAELRSRLSAVEAAEGVSTTASIDALRSDSGRTSAPAEAMAEQLQWEQARIDAMVRISTACNEDSASAARPPTLVAHVVSAAATGAGEAADTVSNANQMANARRLSTGAGAAPTATTAESARASAAAGAPAAPATPNITSGGSVARLKVRSASLGRTRTCSSGKGSTETSGGGGGGSGSPTRGWVEPSLHDWVSTPTAAARRRSTGNAPNSSSSNSSATFGANGGDYDIPTPSTTLPRCLPSPPAFAATWRRTGGAFTNSTNSNTNSDAVTAATWKDASSPIAVTRPAALHHPSVASPPPQPAPRHKAATSAADPRRTSHSIPSTTAPATPRTAITPDVSEPKNDTLTPLSTHAHQVRQYAPLTPTAVPQPIAASPQQLPTLMCTNGSSASLRRLSSPVPRDRCECVFNGNVGRRESLGMGDMLAETPTVNVSTAYPERRRINGGAASATAVFGGGVTPSSAVPHLPDMPEENLVFADSLASAEVRQLRLLKEKYLSRPRAGSGDCSGSPSSIVQQQQHATTGAAIVTGMRPRRNSGASSRSNGRNSKAGADGSDLTCEGSALSLQSAVSDVRLSSTSAGGVFGGSKNATGGFLVFLPEVGGFVSAQPESVTTQLLSVTDDSTVIESHLTATKMQAGKPPHANSSPRDYSHWRSVPIPVLSSEVIRRVKQGKH